MANRAPEWSTTYAGRSHTAPGAPPGLSPELSAELSSLRETGKALAGAMTSPSARARLAQALLEIDQIPLLFQHDAEARRALVLPTLWIREIAAVHARLGDDASYFASR